MFYVVTFDSQMTKVFEEEEDPEGALVCVKDGSLRDSYPMDDLYKVNLSLYNTRSEKSVHGKMLIFFYEISLFRWLKFRIGV